MKTKEIVLPENWEVKEVIGNRIILKEKEKELPKTWKECYDSLECLTLCDKYERNNIPSDIIMPMQALCQLLVFRNAWWKKLGWKPDWSNCSKPFKWCIHDNGGFVMVTSHSKFPRILAFPDRETADMFLETFRNLIEEAKVLL